jgi:hypothetical protein
VTDAGTESTTTAATASTTGTTTSSADGSSTGSTSGGSADESSTGDASDCPGGQPPAGTVDYAVTMLATASGTGSNRIAAGRIDADETLDFVVISRDQGSAEIFLGDGEGAFNSSTLELDPQGFPSDVVLRSISDGATDMLVAMDGPAELWIYRGSADGNFGALQTFPTPTNALDVGDFNDDGVLDVGIINGSGLAVRLGVEVGETLGPQVDYAGPAGSQIEVANLLGSSALDIIASGIPSGEIAFLRGEGDGTFSAQSSLVVGAFVSAFAVADFDVDAQPDLLVSTSSGDLRVYYGQPGGSISASGVSIGNAGDIQSNLAAVDVDADGIEDIISAGGFDISVRFSHGDRSYSRPITTSCGGPPSYLVHGDFNADCVTDVIATDVDGELCLLMSGSPRP